MTATIRESNVFSDLFQCLLGKIKTISDPGNRNTHWIFSAFPEKLINTEKAYPIITIESADVAYNPLTMIDVKRGPVRFAINVFSTDGIEMDSLASSIVDKMESNENNFQISGIHTMRMIGTTYTQYPRDGFRVHNKVINYEFDFGWY